MKIEKEDIELLLKLLKYSHEGRTYYKTFSDNSTLKVDLVNDEIIYLDKFLECANRLAVLCAKL